MIKENVVRVLQVGMSPYYGGTEAFLMSQYRAIDKSKVQFDFLNVYDKKIACQDEIESMGGKIYHLNMARHQGVRAYYKNLDDFFKTNAKAFDVVHCNYQSLINIDILKYAKRYGIKMRIAHAHNAGYGVNPSYKQKLLILANKMMLRKYATHYYACSTLAAEWMFGRNAIIIKNAINCEKYLYDDVTRKSVRENLKITDAFVVMFVGRLDPQKNPLFLLEVFKEIRKMRADAQLLIIGDGILRQEVEVKLSTLGIEDSVKMLGSREDVASLLQAADVFLLPSKFEGLGIVLIEAQAASLPCFTSEEVVPAEVDVTGLVSFIPLENSAKMWANTIVTNAKKTRENQYDTIKAAGYDSAYNAKYMEMQYSIVNDN